VTVFFENKEINPFMASGRARHLYRRLQRDISTTAAGLLGGAWIQAGTSNGRPILTRPVPPGTPRWGRD